LSRTQDLFTLLAGRLTRAASEILLVGFLSAKGAKDAKTRAGIHYSFLRLLRLFAPTLQIRSIAAITRRAPALGVAGGVCSLQSTMPAKAGYSK
jgi:hypothetical protein